MSESAASQLFAQLDPELWIVTAQAGSRRGGLIATFVNQASIVPGMPRVLVGLACQHHTCRLLEESQAFALHLIDESQVDWVWRFGLGSGAEVDKLEGLAVRSGVSGSPILAEAGGWMDCRVETRLETGDRKVYLAEVVAADLSALRPLTLKRLLAISPREKLQELKALMARDMAVDEAAIAAWRKDRLR